MFFQLFEVHSRLKRVFDFSHGFDREDVWIRSKAFDGKKLRQLLKHNNS